MTSDPQRISDTYTAVAASQDEIQSDQFQSKFVQIWLHIVFILFPIATVILVYTCDPVQLLLGDKTWKNLCNERNHPRIAAMIQISVVFTLYVFALDSFAFVYTLNSDLHSKSSHTGFYLTTVTGVVVDLVAILLVTFTLITSCHWECCNVLRGKICKPVNPKKLLVSITFSPLLCVANHVPYVILSFISDPYHAGSVAMGYFITGLLFYRVYQRFYSQVVLRTSSRLKEVPYPISPDLVHCPDNDTCRRNGRVPFNTQVLLLSLIVVSPLLVLYESILIVLLRALPITQHLDDFPTRLYTIYQGSGILTVALLTYAIVLSPSPSSLIGALDKLGKQLKIPEKLGRKWVRMGDEEKAAVVIRTLYEMGSSESKVEDKLLNLEASVEKCGTYFHGYEAVVMEDRNGSATMPRVGNKDIAEQTTLQMESTPEIK